jgi:cell division protein FtsW (lipid II flippase)
VNKIFSIPNPQSSKDRIQSRLLVIASLIIIAYSLILSLAPVVRNHSNSVDYQFSHWIGTLVWVVSFVILNQLTSRKLPHRDPYLIPIVALLCGLGLMTIWRLFPNFGLKQTIWLFLSAMVVAAGLLFPKYLEYLKRYKYLWLVLGLILTALTIFWGTNPSGSGPNLWFNVLGVYFQPSEPLKLLLIAFMAGYFADRLPSKSGKIQNLMPTLLINGIAILLLIFQRDLGTASVFLMLYLAMLFTSQGSKKVLWITPVVFLIAGIAGYFLIDIVHLRINAWLQPFQDPSGTSFQIIQSMIAFAEGDIIGSGPGLGSPNLIPVSVSDFIFPAITEELGLLGAIVLLLLIILIIHRGIKISTSSPNAFYRYLSIGLIFYFGFQSILIVGGNLGLLPLTGVTLPFVSYGGTSLLVSFFGLLILLTISNQPTQEHNQHNIKQPRYYWMSGALMLFLVVEIIITSLYSFWFRTPLVDRAENIRWSINDRFVERGDILERNNKIIITNTGESGSYQRVSNYIPLNPVIGYTNPIYGQTGIEASMYSYLRGYEGNSENAIFSQEILYNQPPEGLDIRLTIDLTLQEKADNLLGDQKGAVIVMNANSGEILVMASHPYFDTALLEEEWENLVNDQDAPLVNRATQGKYPAGTALFPIILSTAMRNGVELPDFLVLEAAVSNNPECLPQDNTLSSWGYFVNYGCAEAQKELIKLLDEDQLLDAFQDFGLFSEPALYLNVADAALQETENLPTFRFDSNTFTVTPLQMTLAASVITNGGSLPGARIVNAYQSPDQSWVTIPKIGSTNQVLSSETTALTSQIIKIPDLPYWQTIGTQYSVEGDPATWFIAGTTSDWPGQPITIVVLLESNSPDLAQEIGRSLINELTNYQIITNE